MKVANTIRDDTGARHYRKYHSHNPVQQWVLNRFFNAVAHEIRGLAPKTTLEFGCGEGFFMQQLTSRDVTFPSMLGIDLREDALEQARKRNPIYKFEKVDLLEWDMPDRSFDLVIASEVLEHLPEPELFLKRLAALSDAWLLLTVPWEPWFRLMNLLRGRDITRFGNHPEHINAWSFDEFKKFVSRQAVVLRAFTIFPFIIILAKPVICNRH